MRLLEVWTAAFFGVFAIFAAGAGWGKFCLDHDDKWWWYPLFMAGILAGILPSAFYIAYWVAKLAGINL